MHGCSTINGGPMIIQCPACKARYRIDAGATDKPVVRVKCPKCSHGFEVKLASPATAGSRSIVVVDDARFFRDVIADILAPLDCPLQLAGTGEEGLKLIRELRPKLVILDLKLPGMNGFELIKEIRADHSLAGIKILAMSSVYRQDDEVHKVILAGADEFLNKSFKPEHLLGRVRQLLTA
jgi:predicted Zn finger-like uncharacterized protein